MIRTNTRYTEKPNSIVFLCPSLSQRKVPYENNRKGDCAKEKGPFGCFDDHVARGGWHNRSDNGTGENTVGECYEVVQEPGTAGSDERFPVIAKDKAVWDALLDGSANVKNTAQHADSEVEDRERE